MSPIRTRSFNETGRAQLASLWRAVHETEPPPGVLEVFDQLVPARPANASWPSHVSDDHTPYELSLLLGDGKPELRLMAEVVPGGREVTVGATVLAGREVLRLLSRDHGVDTSRLEAVADLFLAHPEGAFGLWLAASFQPSGAPSFKVYLNPLARGVTRAPALVEEMLQTLGFLGAWGTVTRAMTRGPELDELRFVSLDLGRDDAARVKVYGFHRDATPEYLADVVSVVPGVDRARVLGFVRTMTGGDGVLAAGRSPATCLAFVAGDAHPRSGTVHVPVRAFAGDDGAAHRRLLLALTELGLPTLPYERAVEALAQRPLEAGSGLLAWAALRSGEKTPKVNVYLAPRAIADEVPHPTVEPTLDVGSPEALVRRCDAAPITEHPFWQRLAREPFEMRPLALFLFNIREAITRGFARRLASVVARVEEDDIRSILAKQLNDELGDGDPLRTHKILFERFVDGLGAWAPDETTGAPELAPGRELGRAQEELYLGRSAYEGVGATLVMEVFGKQADQFMGAQLRRDRETLPATVTEWLTLHEELENEHADESHDLARRIPKGSKATLAARGASEVRAACWSFLDGVYRIAYGG